MAAVLQIGQVTLDASALVAKLKEHHLMPRLVQEVVIDEAIADIECDPQTAMQAFCTKRGLFSREQQQAWCQQQQQAPEQMMQTAVREQKLLLFQEKIWGEQIESYFLQRKAQLDRVRYSLIRTKDVSLAQEVYFRLNDDGVSFASLASQYSEGQEAKTGGMVGPVELSVPHPILARMLMVSKPGQLWAPTQIGEWLVIAKLEQFIPAQFDGPMRERLLAEQFQTWLSQKLEETVVVEPDEIAEANGHDVNNAVAGDISAAAEPLAPQTNAQSQTNAQQISPQSDSLASQTLEDLTVG